MKKKMKKKKDKRKKKDQNKAHVGPWSSGRTFTFSLLCISSCCLSHAVVRACRSTVSFFYLFFLDFFFKFLNVSVLKVTVRRLRVAVDGDVGQVVPDDLVDWRGRQNKRQCYQTEYS